MGSFKQRTEKFSGTSASDLKNKYRSGQAGKGIHGKYILLGRSELVLDSLTQRREQARSHIAYQAGAVQQAHDYDKLGGIEPTGNEQ